MKLTEYEKPKDLRPMAETCTVFLRSLEAKIVSNPEHLLMVLHLCTKCFILLVLFFLRIAF